MRKGKLALSQPVDILTKEPFFYLPLCCLHLVAFSYPKFWWAFRRLPGPHCKRTNQNGALKKLSVGKMSLPNGSVRDRFAHVRCSNFFPAWKSSWSNAVIILALQSFVNNWALSVSSWKAMVWYSNEFRTTGAKRFHLFTCTLR